MGIRHEENTVSKRIIKMADKLLKRCSTSLAIKKTQMKTTMIYTTSKLPDWQEKKKEWQHQRLVRLDLDKPHITSRNVIVSFLKRKHATIVDWDDPPIALTGIHPREIKIYIHSKSGSPMFIATLLTSINVKSCL